MLSLHLPHTPPLTLLKSNHKKPTNHLFLHFNPNLSSSSTTKFNNKLPFVAASAASTASQVAEEAVGLPPGLRREAMPLHVAVIMDGNVRWAKQRGLPGGAGHEAGVRSLRQMVELCLKWGIKVLTVFAFSYDNWVRPQVSYFLSSLLFFFFSSFFFLIFDKKNCYELSSHKIPIQKPIISQTPPILLPF